MDNKFAFNKIMAHNKKATNIEVFIMNEEKKIHYTKALKIQFND